jgi:hypothetical protein
MLLAGSAVVSFSSAAPAWEVNLDASGGWRSIYCSGVAGVKVQSLNQLRDQCMKLDKNKKEIANTGSFHGAGLFGNEHAEIADHVFWSVSNTLWQKFGTAACKDTAKADANCPRMVDLNASWLRADRLHPGGIKLEPDLAGDDPNTVLDERRFPPLAMWSGLPDFAYTVYDWINLRKLCPSVPKDADRADLCHEYTGWLGAGLNSTHFGHLPLKVYSRYHKIALALATKANQLRATLKAGGADGWHRDYILELERLALAYEATGQHFVQDRWAAGHMIARWGPGSYSELPRAPGKKPRLKDAAMMGVMTGVLHGTQAVFHHPDPLNGPLLKSSLGSDLVNFIFKGSMPDTSGTFARWRYDRENKFSPPKQSQNGVGDFLFRALKTSAYTGDDLGVDPVSPALSTAGAANQLKGMRYCAAQGLRQVIAAFGTNDTNGYGLLDLPLPEPDQAEQMQGFVPGALKLGKDPASDDLCTSQWVTNESWYMGLRTLSGQDLLAYDVILAGKSAIVDPSPAFKPDWLVFRIIEPYTKLRLQALERVQRDKAYAPKSPDGRVEYRTDLARDGISMWSNGFWWKGNQNYKLPEYYEPEDLDSLPELDDATGRDKAAIYGLFNKASAEYWCARSLSQAPDGKTSGSLAELRDQIVSETKDTKKRTRLTATCSYLAERFHKGTDPAYLGARKELAGEFLPFNQTTKHGPTYEPVCKFLDKTGFAVTTDANDDTRPYFLHPGYVETSGKKGPGGHAADSLENWCEKLPVVDIASTPQQKDVVFTIDATSTRWTALTGENFGKKTPSGKTGQVQSQNAQGQWQALDVWDETTQSTSGGWSDDGKLLYARLPPAKKGFPTTATSSMSIQALLGLTPSYYPVKIVRANDSAASLIEFLSNGAETVGSYVLEVHPQVLQVQWAPVAAGTTEIRAEFCYAKWLRPDIELLAKGVYRLQGTSYTPVTVPFTWYDDIPWQPTPGITCDPASERGGASIANPSPAVFDGSAVFVFAYH